MSFEQSGTVSEKQLRQEQLEKLQSLSAKEKLVLFELAFRLGVTSKKEATTNFLSQLHAGHLAGLFEVWHAFDMKLRDQGMDVAMLSDAEKEDVMEEAMGVQQ